MFDVTLEGEAEFEKAVRHFVQDVWRGARDAVRDAGTAGIEAAKQAHFKDQTGALRREMVFVMMREADIEVEGEMRSPMPYSSYVDEGTGPHDIWPKAARGFEGPLRAGQSRRRGGHERQALRWTNESGTHFARMVHHPGSRAYPFFGTAYIVAEQRLNARLEANMAKAIENFR